MCEDVSVETKEQMRKEYVMWHRNTVRDASWTLHWFWGYVWEEERERDRGREIDRDARAADSANYSSLEIIITPFKCCQERERGKKISCLSFCSVFCGPLHSNTSIHWWHHLNSKLYLFEAKSMCVTFIVCISSWILCAYDRLKNKSAFSGRAGHLFWAPLS